MSHHLTNLIVHVVFTTKNRQPWLHRELRPHLFRYLEASLRRESSVPLKLGGVTDHVHLLFRLAPPTALSTVVGRVKGNSSRWLNQELIRDFQFSWQTGYGAFSVARQAVPALCRYIQNQEVHHRTLTYAEELDRLTGQRRG